MSGIRKWLAKDKYWIVRGSVALLVLLALFAALVVEMLSNVGRASVEERASDVASRVVAQFEEMIRGAFIDIYGAASLISEDPSREDLFFEALYRFNTYDEVGVLSNGVVRHQDGTTHTIEYDTPYIYKVGGETRGRIISLHDGSLVVCAPMGGGRELAARFDSDDLERILGSSFPENYDFAVYNATTGVYLVNHTSYSGGGYYDALLSINEGGSTAGLLQGRTTVAHISHGGADGGGVYIAQQRSAIRPWNVALVIPESAVSAYIMNRGWMLYAIAGAVLLILAVHTLFTLIALRRIRRERNDVASAQEDSARMLNDMAREAEVTLFIYHRGQDSLMRCYDGLQLLGEGQGRKRLASLPELEAACGLDEGDVERLHGRLSELKRGESAELLLRGALPDREERKLSFKLIAHAEDGEVIVCSVRDYTQQLLSRSRAEVEQNYLESTVQRSIAVWTVNVTRNLWRNVYMRDPEMLGPLGEFQGADWRDFTADLGGALRDFIYPADYAEHVQQMNIPTLAESYRSGRTEFDTDYRVCSKSMEQYVWHRMHVRIFSDPETGDIIAHVFVFNVDVEKNAELERGERKRVFKKTLRALSGMFFGLYYVDLDNDLCYAAKSYDGEVVTNLSAPYRETFDRYLDGVHPEDRERVRAMLDAFAIRRAVSDDSFIQRVEYRRRSGDEYRRAAIIIQPARYENGRIKDVVIAMRYLVSDSDRIV